MKPFRRYFPQRHEPASLNGVPSTLPPQDLKKGCSLAAFGVYARSAWRAYPRKSNPKGHADGAKRSPQGPSAKRMFITRWGYGVKPIRAWAAGLNPQPRRAPGNTGKCQNRSARFFACWDGHPYPSFWLKASSKTTDKSVRPTREFSRSCNKGQ